MPVGARDGPGRSEPNSGYLVRGHLRASRWGRGRAPPRAPLRTFAGKDRRTLSISATLEISATLRFQRFQGGAGAPPTNIKPPKFSAGPAVQTRWGGVVVPAPC